jgi:hypothetical protein
MAKSRVARPSGEKEKKMSKMSKIFFETLCPLSLAVLAAYGIWFLLGPIIGSVTVVLYVVCCLVTMMDLLPSSLEIGAVWVAFWHHFGRHGDDTGWKAGVADGGDLYRHRYCIPWGIKNYGVVM